MTSSWKVLQQEFQLTPSRKATRWKIQRKAGWVISTHAFTEGDPASFPKISNSDAFQLTPSRKATIALERKKGDACISTHAFTEGDILPLKQQRKSFYFNSRLHGRRLQIQIIFAAKHFLFLLILSKFLILAFLFHLASLRFSLHPVIFRCESPCIFLFIYLSHSKHVHSVIIFNLLHYISPLIFYQLKICFNLISLLFKINLLKFFVIFYWHRKMPVIKFIKF